MTSYSVLPSAALLKGRQFTFTAISMAILAEKILLTEQGMIPGTEKEIKRDKDKLIEIYNEFKAGDHEDPFSVCFSASAIDYKEIYQRIAY